MIGDKHAQPPFHEPADYFLDILDGDGIDTGKGFIQKHKLGVIDKRPGNFHPSPLSSRQGISLGFAQMGYVKLVEQLLQTALSLLAAQAPELEYRHDVVLN